MADTSERKGRALDSPLFKLIEETWIDYDSRITSFSISEEDVFRYTLWCIEGLKDNSCNRKWHETKMRSLLFQQIRNRYRTKCQPEELNLMADVIMAYTLECLEWAQTADWTTFMSIYEKVLFSIDTDKEYILGYKKGFNAKVFEMDLCTSFKEWIEDYLTNDVFLTDENTEWIEEEQLEKELGSDTNIDSLDYEMTAEEWVNRYESKITSLLKERKYLIGKIEKLRVSYIDNTKQQKFNRTRFLRDNIFWPKSPWLKKPIMFPAEAIRDLFNDKNFTDQIVSKAKKKK